MIVLHTTEGGARWHEQLRTKFHSGNAATIQFGSSTKGILLYKNVATMQTVVYRTTDGGQSWMKSIPSSLGGRIFAGRPVFQSGGSIWIPTSAGAAPFPSSIVSSGHIGKTWHIVVQRGERRNITISHSFGNTAYVLAGLSQGYAILKSTDGGELWSQLRPAVEPSQGISFVSPTVGFALGTEANGRAVLKTVDGGKTWSTVGSIPEGIQSYDMGFSGDKVGYLTTSPMKTSTGQGSTVVMETQDGAKTWTQAPFGALPREILHRISNSGSIVEPTYFLPNKSGDKHWVIATSGYPKLYSLTSSGHKTKLQATFDNLPGTFESYSFLNRTNGWMSMLRTGKSGSPSGQSDIKVLDAAKGTWVTKWTLPKGWAVGCESH